MSFWCTFATQNFAHPTSDLLTSQQIYLNLNISIKVLGGPLDEQCNVGDAMLVDTNLNEQVRHFAIGGISSCVMSNKSMDFHFCPIHKKMKLICMSR